MVGVGYAYNSSDLVSAYSSEKCYASPSVAFTESECCEFTGGPFSFLPATPRGAGFFIAWLFLLLWIFAGVALGADIFMTSIEVITSKDKKVKIKVNGKVFSRGEVPEKDLFGDTWNGRVDGTTEDESANRRQMFAKRASFKTCAVISSGAALKGKRYGKTIDEHEVVVRLNNAPTIGYENDVGSFTTLRLTNTQYEGVREYEDETVLTKWNGNPMDLMRLGTKKTYAMNPAFRQWAQQLDDTLNNHIVTSGLLMLFLLLQKCERVSAFGFGGKELEKWYYDKRPSGKIPKSAWLNSGRGLVKYDHWNTVSTNAREEAVFGAKENRTLAEQPKVKVYGKKDKRIGDMLGIGAGKMANANKKKKT